MAERRSADINATRLPRVLSACFSAAGLGISIYLSVVHLTGERVPLLCSATGPINCQQVTTSPESYVGPVPVAFLGVVWFLIALALSLARWREGDRSILRLHLAWSSLGTVFALYLIYAELYLIGAICLWCTVVHVLVFAQFILSVGASGESVSNDFPRTDSHFSG